MGYRETAFLQMFQRAVARYGLAASLSLLAAIPLAVAVFAGPRAAATTALWLAFPALEWLLVQPSVKKGEGFRDARRRVLSGMVRDPLFWFGLFALLFAGARALNGGIGLAYDPETAVWSVSEPWTIGLPASADGAGYPLFAAAVAFLVTVEGIRHGLGKSARAMCLVMASVVAGCAGIAAAVAVCAGNEHLLKLAGTGLFAPTWAGDAFSVWFVASAAALGQVEERGWKKAGLPAVFVAIAGTAAGTVFLCPPLVALGAAVAAAVAAVISMNYAGVQAGLVASARAVVVFVLAVSLPLVALTGLADEDLCKAKLEGLVPSNALTERQQTMRGALTGNALAMWQESPWLGAGVGVYRIKAPFCAEKADWADLPYKIEFVPNGYAQMLAERGIVGCMVVVLGLGLLVGTGIARFASSYKALASASDMPSPVLCVPPVGWAQFPLIAFLGALCAYAASPVIQAQTWTAAAFTLAMASASFPQRRKQAGAGAVNTEK